MTVTIANVLSGGAAPSSGANSTASWTPNAAKHYLLSVTSYVSTGSAPPSTPTISGNGVTWHLLGSVQGDNSGTDRSEQWIWSCSGSGGSAGATTITWGAVVPNKSAWAIDVVTGGGSGLASGTLPQAAATSTASSANPTVTLGSGLQSNSVTYALIGWESNSGSLSAGSGYTTLATDTSQSFVWLQTEWDSAGSTTGAATNSTNTNRHGIILIEVPAGASSNSGTGSVDMHKMGLSGSGIAKDIGTGSVAMHKMGLSGHGLGGAITDTTSVKAIQRSAADRIGYLFDGSMIMAHWNGSAGQISHITSPLTSQVVTSLITTTEDTISLWVDNSGGTSSDIWIASGDDDGSGVGPSLSVRHGTYDGSNFTWDASTVITGTITAATIQPSITWNGTYLMVFWWDGTSGSDRVSYAYTTTKAGTSGWSTTATFSESSTWSTIVQVVARHSTHLAATIVVYGGGSAMHYACLPDASVPSIGNWGGRTFYDRFDDSLTGFGGPQMVIDEVTGDIHVARSVVNVGGPTWDGVTYWLGAYNSGANTVSFGTRVIVDATLAGTTGPADIAVAVTQTHKVYVVWTTDVSSDSMKYSTLVSPFTSAVAGGTFTTHGSNPRYPHVPAVSSSQGGLSGKLPVLYMDATSSPYPIKLDVSVALPSLITGTGSVAMHKMGLSGAGDRKVSGTGSVAMHKMGLSGTGTSTVSGTGSVAMHKMGLSGTGGQKISGTGSVAMHKMGLSGTGDRKVSGTGSVSMHKMGLSGAGTSTVSGTGSVAMHKMGLSATGDRKVSGTGSVSMHKMGLSGSGTAKVTGTGSVDMHKMGLSVSGVVKVIGTGSVTMHKMGLAGVGTNATVISGTGSVSMHKMGLSASGVPKVIGTGSVGMHKMGLSASGVAEVIGTGSVAMHKMGLSGSGVQIVTGTGSVEMRKMQVQGTNIPGLQASSLFVFSFR